MTLSNPVPNNKVPKKESQSCLFVILHQITLSFWHFLQKNKKKAENKMFPAVNYRNKI